jgi:tryptophan-rich hypothetical protein
MNRINPAKLLHSKWTAVEPKNKEKHFLVVEVDYDEEGVVIDCLLEAVISRNGTSVDWRDLTKGDRWKQGWK